MKNRSISLLPVILPIFFISGAAGGVYEVIWAKELILIFGATAFAVSTVLASYMAGLAIGSYLFGKYIDRSGRNPIAIFALLELGIGVFGILILIILPLVNRIYYSLYPSLITHTYLRNIVRFLLCFVVLIIPTILMGGTLPVLTKGLVQKEKFFGLFVGRLYAVNTVGAMTGALCVGFFILPALGVRLSTVTAFILNAVTAVIAYVAYRYALGTKPAEEIVSRPAGGRRDDGRRTGQKQRATVPGTLLLVVAGIAGFSSLSYEVIYTRLLRLVFSNTVYAFTIILVAFLAGIALGSFVIARFADRIKDGAFTIGMIQLVLGIIAVWTIPIVFNSLWILNKLYTAFGGMGWGGYTVTRFTVSFIIILGTAGLSGATFPLVMKFRRLEIKRIGMRVGQVYSVNTIAAVLGAFLSGFFIIPALGTYWGLLAIVFLNLCAGLLCLVRSGHRMKHGIAGIGILLVIVSIYANPRMVFVGKLKRPDEKITVAYLDEGANASVYLLENVETKAKRLYTDGILAIDTNFESLQTVSLLGHIPTLLCRNPKDVLVIGFGMGKTASSIAKHPVERIDCVEIVPEILRAARFFHELNDNILEEPRLNIVIDDGRSYLFGIDRTYDVISCDPIHPAFGSPALYTDDYYRECRRKLNNGGIIVQYLPFHQLSPYDLAILLKTFSSVFPHTTVWLASYHGVIVGSKDRLMLDPEELGRRIDEASVREDLLRCKIDGLGGFLGHLVLGEDQVRSLISGVEDVNTDNHPILEYAEARFFGTDTWVQNMENLIRYAKGNPYKTIFGTESIDRIQDVVLADIFEARLHAARARLYFQKGMHNRAVDEFIKQLRITPGDIETFHFAGDALNSHFIARSNDLLRQGDAEAAFQYLTSALELGIRTCDIYASIGVLQVQAGDTLSGITSLEKALKIDPSHAAARRYLQAVLKEHGSER
ncbi:MAG: fused MFS/spermidine synthase [bacterium]|nr:MAG: fused MFS/spermidine synthase [bacterium]